MLGGGNSSVGMIKKLSGRHTGAGNEGDDFVPKGLEDSARGFNPGERPKNRPPQRGGRYRPEVSRIKAWFANNSLPPRWGGAFSAW